MWGNTLILLHPDLYLYIIILNHEAKIISKSCFGIVCFKLL